MNLDGTLDLILDDAPFDGSGNFAVNLLPGNGDGTFSAGHAVYSNYLVSQIIAGEFSQDGKPDLILFSEGEQTSTNPYDTAGILLLPGAADGTFGVGNEIGTGNFFLNGALTDVNNDGIPGLIAYLFQTIGQPNTYYGLSTTLGTGNGEFTPPINSLIQLNSVLPLAGNFLADNATDFIVSTPYGTGLFLGQGGTTMSLSASAASIPLGQAETVTATLSPTLSGRPTPTGSVNFYDGATPLGSVPLSGATAAYSSSSLTTGTHSITATYAGNGNFNPNSTLATSLTVTTVAPAFTLAAAPGSVTVPIGQQGVATLTLTSNVTFNGSVSLACSGLPANTSCIVNPSQVTLAGSSMLQASLIIGTTTNAATRPANKPGSMLPLFEYGGGLSVAGLLCCCLRRRRLQRMAATMIVLILGFSASAGLSGCGSSSSAKAAQKGTYTVTVTATPSVSTISAQTATVSVTLQ